MEPTNENNSVPNNTPESGGMGPLIGSVVVIIILVIGAIYFWGNRLAPEETTDQAAAALSVNDDDTSLQADIQNTPEVEIDTNF